MTPQQAAKVAAGLVPGAGLLPEGADDDQEVNP